MIIKEPDTKVIEFDLHQIEDAETTRRSIELISDGGEQRRERVATVVGDTLKLYIDVNSDSESEK